MSRDAGGERGSMESAALEACPHLPVARSGLDWRALHAFRAGERVGGLRVEGRGPGEEGRRDDEEKRASGHARNVRA